ncbi:2-phosphosulfolactate phosphatase [Gryllotalpicola ginsengisoli]|uniref:2-phosphosulfolactate phosphatase n=1 Tax=Gryllotalpicola ginsengisoli TaxID=444608 RepID=UPI0003B7A8F2|nr:2-phosphosulfolactate phosphatase [Gryllotalpicola ginsengisoli]
MPQPQPAETTQTRYEVRFDWGIDGLKSIAPGAGVIVFVDTISFTTTVELAAGFGLEVEPYPTMDREAAAAYAAAVGAKLAGRRGEAGLTLSPTSMTPENAAASGAGRLVVLSLNGSRVAAAAAGFGVPVVAANLRNFSAVARWVLAYQQQLGTRANVAVVASGERRADDSLRPAVEDQLAAGAVVEALQKLGIDFCSPEAAVAAAAFAGLRGAVKHLLTASVSGQELAAVGQLDDVKIAAQLDVSDVVPVMRDGVFRAVPRAEQQTE